MQTTFPQFSSKWKQIWCTWNWTCLSGGINPPQLCRGLIIFHQSSFYTVTVTSTWSSCLIQLTLFNTCQNPTSSKQTRRTLPHNFASMRLQGPGKTSPGTLGPHCWPSTTQPRSRLPPWKKNCSLDHEAYMICTNDIEESFKKCQKVASYYWASLHNATQSDARA